jgi:hypothetical protein
MEANILDTGRFVATISNITAWPCRSSSGLSLASNRGGPGSLLGSVWGLWWTKRHWEQSFSEYFGFPCQSFHQFLHHDNHPGLAQ